MTCKYRNYTLTEYTTIGTRSQKKLILVLSINDKRMNKNIFTVRMVLKPYTREIN